MTHLVSCFPTLLYLGMEMGHLKWDLFQSFNEQGPFGSAIVMIMCISLCRIPY